MSNYKESKKKLDVIRRKYSCKGDIIIRTAIQSVVEIGQNMILSDNWYAGEVTEINTRHDIAEKEGKWLFMTRDFELAILECMRDLAAINSYDLMIYIQREVWLGGGEVGEPDYQRALEIIRNCLCYTADCYGSSFLNESDALRQFREMELTDEEICYFGWEDLIEKEYEEEEE